MHTVVNETILNDLNDLFFKWASENAQEIKELPSSGSYRKYYRITGKSHLAIGAFNNNPAENMAFISLSHHFREKGMMVPDIFQVSEDYCTYLLEDLGDVVLFDKLATIRQKDGIGDEFMDYYKKMISDLIQFQMVAGKSVDFSLCYPVQEFDKQAYLWDLNYFKYSFLKPFKIPFDEYLLELDFDNLSVLLMKPPYKYFVYRDFQSRNVMVKDGALYYIDFQGGRKGPLHYDLASLLFQARANLPVEIREKLVDYYIEKASALETDSANDFREYFYHFVLIRVLQTLGAYGFRGLYEKKQHFIASIPKAIENVKWLLDNDKVPQELSELKKCLSYLVLNNEVKELYARPLCVQINSFSYKRGIPVDLSGNGGGFVFDCRGLPNPGRLAQYSKLTGEDQEVSSYLESFDEVGEFIENAFQMVSRTIATYSSLNFSNLMVSFGCTGGQHRSIYCAIRLAQKLQKFDGIKFEVRHREQEKG
jgi:aminoglycoside/choline kinase family phosphotransferase